MNWYSQVNYVATQNYVLNWNGVAVYTAAALVFVAVVALAWLWDPTGVYDQGGNDDTGLAPDHKLQRQIIINDLALRLAAR
jgi:hypothetical protein